MTHPHLDNDRHREMMRLLRESHATLEAERAAGDRSNDAYWRMDERNQAARALSPYVDVALHVSAEFEREIRTRRHCEGKPKLSGHVYETLDGQVGASYQCSGCPRRCGWAGPGCDLQYFQPAREKPVQLSLFE